MRSSPSTGWILAGALDGAPAAPGLLDDVAGMPYALRLACDLAIAGAKQIAVVWSGDGAVPDLAAIAADPRLASRASLRLVTAAPPGDDADPVIVVRADRIFHRDMPKQAVTAWRASEGPTSAAKVAGDEHDAVIVTDRATARRLAAAAREPGGWTRAIADLAAATATAEPPYLGFTTPAADTRSLRRAERRLVWSMRKKADGLASSMINRHISLPVSWTLMRTPVLPNHVTVFCFVLAAAGGVVLSRGGYLAGLIGMVLVNLGSIIDGVDGELARLKYRFSRLGQWMDTLADDVGNVAYVTGIALNLRAAGVEWAVPLAITALVAFAITQTTQYVLITTVYKSGDLAAIPWAFQSHDFLTARPTGVIAWLKTTVPKMLKRDFALTMFVGFALIGHLEIILLVFSGGAISFFVVFFIQFFRNRGSLRTA